MPSRRLIKGIIISAGVLLLASVIFLYNTIGFIYNTGDISHQAVSYRLKFLCEGVYQYRWAIGRWPAKAADLAETPMALQMRFWEDDIQSGRVVVVWPRDWPPNPLDNRDRILAYYTAGLISKFGKQWVCWGACAPNICRERSCELP